MNRRKFLNRVMGGAAGTAAGLGLAKAGLKLVDAAPRENHSVAYQVKGFTCVTCATGLEVMLRQQQGVVRATASYPEAKVLIGFDKNHISEEAIREFIASCGFTVA
jgi:anaerobic selenocysteine-containing dehydrogenase